MGTEANRFARHDAPATSDSTLSIAPEEYCRLVISSRPLVRCDDSWLGLKGLQDTETGELFVVRASDLYAHTVTKA
jgi:hypothetical protein